MYDLYIHTLYIHVHTVLFDRLTVNVQFSFKANFFKPRWPTLLYCLFRKRASKAMIIIKICKTSVLKMVACTVHENCDNFDDGA